MGEKKQSCRRESESAKKPAVSATQPSFQIRAALSLGNVTFSWHGRGRDGGSGVQGLDGRGRRQMVVGVEGWGWAAFRW